MGCMTSKDTGNARNNEDVRKSKDLLFAYPYFIPGIQINEQAKGDNQRN